MKKNKFLTWTTWLAVGIFTGWFVFKPGFPGGHDVVAHLTRAKAMIEILNEGQFPPRWVGWSWYGAGAPIFNYYQTGWYWLVASLNLLMSFEWAYKVSIWLVWTAGGVAMWWWRRGYHTPLFSRAELPLSRGDLKGLISGIVWLFSSYVLMDVWVRGSYPELMGMAVGIGILGVIRTIAGCSKFDSGVSGNRRIPRMTNGILKQVQDDKWWYWLLAILIAIGFLSHPPTMIMWLPVGIGYILVSSKIKIQNSKLEIQESESRSQNSEARIQVQGVRIWLANDLWYMLVIKFILAFLLGLVIAGVFLIPAFFESDLIQSWRFTQGTHDFQSHFVSLPQLFWSSWGYGFSETGNQDQMPLTLGLGIWVFVGIGLVLSIWQLATRSQNSGVRSQKSGMSDHGKVYHSGSWILNSKHFEVWFWLAVFVYGIFFSMSVSSDFWEHFGLLQMMAYPWRFLSIATLAGAVLGGEAVAAISSGLYSYREKSHREQGKAWVSVSKGVSRGIAYAHPLEMTVFLVLAGFALAQIPHLKPSTWLPSDFLQVNRDWQSGDSTILVDAESVMLPKSVERWPEKPLPVWQSDAGDFQVEIVENLNHRLRLSVTSAGDGTLQINRFYFPGWKVFVDGKEVSIEVLKPEGVMLISIPEGKHHFDLKFIDTPVRRWSGWVSLVSLLAWVGWGVKIFLTK